MTNVSFFPGCSLDGTGKEYGESTEAICKTLGIKLRELDDWNCCGSSSAHVTSDLLAVALPARNLEIADKAGLDLVVPCAACYQRLKYAEKELLAGKDIKGISRQYEGNFHIKHIVDFMWEDIGEKAINAKIRKTLKGLRLVCYYGCLTVRPPKITDARNTEDPRAMDGVMEILGADARNWSYKTDCCGGNLILTRPDIARTLIQKLVDMAEEAGADCIVTGCPMCFSNLDSRQKEISKNSGKEYKTPIFYFSELIGLAFGDADVKKWLRRHIVDPKPLLKLKGLM
ncbi:CoB--CoM heterodisulfide reductase iron-sulfur subunit B family protein [Chloroflexota bacterium]